MAQFPCLLDQHTFDTWYSNIPDNGDLSYEEQKDQLKEDFCLQPTHIMGARDELNSRKQKHGDNVEDFVKGMQQNAAYLQVSNSELQNILFMNFLPQVKAFAIGNETQALKELICQAYLSD